MKPLNIVSQSKKIFVNNIDAKFYFIILDFSSTIVFCNLFINDHSQIKLKWSKEKLISSFKSY